MFGQPPRKAEVIRHWYALVPGFTTPALEFYADIEKSLHERQVPGLEISRVEFAEGGLLSDKRQYLRMTRERLVFDVCAAPFGTSFFFSCRFAEIPAAIQFWQILLLVVTFYIGLALVWNFVGIWKGTVLLLIFCALAVFLLRNAVAMGLRDLDASLVKSAWLGPIYERFFRKETYYREDTRLMYCDLVDQVVKDRVEEVTGAEGVNLVRFNDYNPVLGELYRPTSVALPREQSVP